MAYNPANKDVPCSAYPYKGSIFKLTGAVAGWDELIWPGSARDFFTINHADRGEQWITNCDTGEIAFREWKQGTGWGAVKVFAKGLDLSGYIKTDGTSTTTAAIPFAKGIDITGTDASGWALRIPSTSWIGTSSPGGTLYITSGTTPGNGSRIFLQPDQVNIYASSEATAAQLLLGTTATTTALIGPGTAAQRARTYWNTGGWQTIVGDAGTGQGVFTIFTDYGSWVVQSGAASASISINAASGINNYNAPTKHVFNAPIYTVANQPGIVLNGDPYTGTKPNAYLIGTDGYTQVLHNSATTTAQLTLADNFASINWVSDTNKTTNVRAGSSGIYLQWQDLPTPPVGTQAYLLGIDATGAIIRGTSTTTPNIDYVQFNNAATPSYVEGRVYYNHTDHTLNVMTQFNGVTLQVGEELQKQARNNTGATIADGTVVYVSGATGGIPTIGLADSGNVNTIRRTIGLATHAIGNNTVGRVTTNGAVRDLNTSAFNDGDILYLSTAGGITNVRPTTGLPLQIGVCAYAHPTQGVIDVDPRYDLFGSVMLLNGHNDLALPFSFGDGTTWANSNYGMVIDGSLTHSLWMKGNVRIEQSTTEALSLFKPTAIAGQEVCMTYEMWDTLGGDAEYARTCGEIVSGTAGAYSGRLNFYTAQGGALVKRGYFSESGALVGLGSASFDSFGSFTGYVIAKGSAGTNRGLRIQTGDLMRWYARATSEAESGSNAGSNFFLTAYADDGVTVIDSPLSITRASGGAITLARPTNIVNTTASTSTTTGALVVSGGVGVGGNVNVGGDLTTLGVSTQGAIGDFDYSIRVGGVYRWVIRKLNAESTGNAGSDFALLARADDGALIDTPLLITRASGGAITLARPTNITNTTASTSTTTGALTVPNGGVGVGGSIYAGGVGRFGGGAAAAIGSFTPTISAGTSSNPCYGLYNSDGTKNIRWVQGVETSSGKLVQDVNYSAGFAGYEWRVTTVALVTISAGGDFSVLVGRSNFRTVTATATGEPINIGSGATTTSPSTLNAGAVWMNATNGLQFCSTAGTARTVATLDTAQTFNSVKTFSSTPVISSTTVSTTAGATYTRTNYGLVHYQAGHAQDMLANIYTAPVGTALTNSATETDVNGGTAIFGTRTLSTAVMQIGTWIILRMRVKYTNTAANTLTLKLYWGTLGTGTLLGTATLTRVNAGAEVFDLVFKGVASTAPSATASTSWTTSIEGNSVIEKDAGTSNTAVEATLATSTATALIVGAKWSSALTTSTLQILNSEINIE